MAGWAPGDLFDSAFLEPLVANVPYYEESRNVPSGNGHSARSTTTSQPSAELFCFKRLNMHTCYTKGVLCASKNNMAVIFTLLQLLIWQAPSGKQTLSLPITLNLWRKVDTSGICPWLVLLLNEVEYLWVLTFRTPIRHATLCWEGKLFH